VLFGLFEMRNLDRGLDAVQNLAKLAKELDLFLQLRNLLFQYLDLLVLSALCENGFE